MQYYGVSFKSSDGLTIQNDSIKGDDFYQFLFQSFTNMVAHLEPGGAAYVFHADTEGLNFRRAFIDAGLHLAGVCIWVKNSLVLGRSDYQWQHEPVLYGFLPSLCKVLIYDVQKGGKLPTALYAAVNTVGDGDKPDASFAKHNLGIKARLQIVASDPAHILGNYTADLSGLNVCNQTLPVRTVEAAPGPAIIRVMANIVKSMLGGICFEHLLLRSDLSRVFSPPSKT